MRHASLRCNTRALFVQFQRLDNIQARLFSYLMMDVAALFQSSNAQRPRADGLEGAIGRIYIGESDTGRFLIESQGKILHIIPKGCLS